MINVAEALAGYRIERTIRRFRAAVVCLAALAVAGVCPADDADSSERTPFAVASVASVDRVLGDLEFVLGSAGQADRMDHIRNVLLFLNQLDGVDRDRPFGLLMYLPETPPHEAEAVAFVPVTSLERLQDTLQPTEHFSIKRADDSDRFEFNTSEKSFAGLYAGDWIFLTEQESLLDQQLLDHLMASPVDHEQYDALLSLRRDGVPTDIFDQALTKLRDDLEQDLERKDGENVVEHRIRTRALSAIGGLIERIVLEAESLNFGLEVSESAEQASLDVRLSVGEGSQLAELFGGLARPDSRFSAIDRETAPLTIATTWRLGGETAGIAGELLANVRAEVAGQIEQPGERLGPHPFERILSALSETIDAGDVDGLVQFVEAPDDKFVLVAAAHVADVDSVSVALREIAQYMASENAGRQQIIDVNALTVRDVTLHRIRGTEIRRQDRQLYGDDVSLYLGAGRDALWLAMGGDQTEEALKSVILAPSNRRAVSVDPTAPLPILQASLHLSSWLALAGVGDGEQERKLAQAARLAFSSTDDDGVHLELFADEEGLRLNVRADRGYIRLFGVALAAKMQQ